MVCLCNCRLQSYAVQYGDHQPCLHLFFMYLLNNTTESVNTDRLGLSTWSWETCQLVCRQFLPGKQEAVGAESLHSGLAQSDLVPSCQASGLYIPAAMAGLYLTLQQRGSGLFLYDATQACIRHDFFNVSKETALPSVKILSILSFL